MLVKQDKVKETRVDCLLGTAFENYFNFPVLF